MEMIIDSLLSIGGKLIDKLIPDPVAKAQAQLELAKMAQEGELAKMAQEASLYKTEQESTSQRWSADMGSDSWLSKNIRPATLAYILTAYLALAVMDGSGFHVAEAYVTLLGQWGMLVMSAYFGGRTLEKVMELRSKKENTDAPK